MKKQAKIVAALGLSVGIIAGVYAGIPAFAEGSSSSDVKINVVVSEVNPSISATTLIDGTKVTDTKINIDFAYSDAFRAQYKMYYTNSNGKVLSYLLADHVLTESGVKNGTDTLSFDLADYGDVYGTYTIIATVNDKSSTADSVSFDYVPAAEVVGKQTENSQNGNPIIKIATSKSVKKLYIQLYDKSGKALLLTPVLLIPDADGNANYEAKLTELAAGDGTYTVVITAYDENDNIIGKNVTTEVGYQASPNIPNTGGSFFAGLNLSRSDYISTGLAILFVAGFFGIMIIRKKSKNSR